MSTLVIYSNLSITSPVSIRAAPPSSLKPKFYRSPYIRFIEQDNDKNQKGGLEEDPLESDLEIKLDLNPESNFDSISLYSALSYLTHCQPHRRWSPKYLNWSLLQPPPSSSSAV